MRYAVVLLCLVMAGCKVTRFMATDEAGQRWMISCTSDSDVCHAEYMGSPNAN